MKKNEAEKANSDCACVCEKEREKASHPNDVDI